MKREIIKNISLYLAIFIMGLIIILFNQPFKVHAEEANFTISIPKTIILDGQTGIGEYQISINGDIANDEKITVTPDSNFIMSQTGKSDITATVEQDKTKWNFDELSTKGNGVITANVLSAGKWTGSFEFNINIETQSLAPGLYETGTTNMTKSWHDLLTEGTIHVNEGILTSNFDNNKWTNSSSDALTGDLVIDSSITSIGDYAFCECTNLTSVTIPDSVTTIGEDAFYYCTSLTSVTIPNSVTTIGEEALAYCENLTSVTIPDSVTTIGNLAFQYCTSLTSVTIPDSVTSLGEWTFDSCTSLTSVTIPNSVTTISEYTFYNCTSLTSITIPDSVTTIGEGVFYDCTSLTSVTIPDSVTTISSDAFRNVPNVNYNGTATGRPWGAFAINGRSVISFTIAGTSYQAEEGMTWAEWVDSEYNTGGIYISNRFVYRPLDVNIGITPITCVLPDELIITDYSYVDVSNHTGGAN